MRCQKPRDEDIDWQEGDDYCESDNDHRQMQKPRYAKKRVLQRWGPDEDQFLLLAIVSTAREKNIELPWYEIGLQCVPIVTPEAIKQHLSKVQKARKNDSRRCPSSSKDKSAVEKPAAIVRHGRGQNLLPPPSKPRGVQQKRGYTSDVEEDVQAPRKKANRGRQNSTTQHVQPTTKRSQRIDEISGYQLGSAEQERFLCDEVSSVNAITTSNMPLNLDFMGNQYEYIFDNDTFEGSNSEIHQNIINQTAARCRQAGTYPGDEQIMAASKDFGLSGGLETSFQLRQLRYPVPRFRGEAPKVDYSALTKHEASPAQAVVIESPKTMQQSGAKAEVIPTIKVELAEPSQSLLEQQFSGESSYQAPIAQMQSSVDNAANHFSYQRPYSSTESSTAAADPRFVGWNHARDPTQDFMQSMYSFQNASQAALDWSPSKVSQYTAASDAHAFNACNTNGYGYDAMPTMPQFEPSENAAIYTGAPYINLTPPDSLNTSQLISPVHASSDPIADTVPAINSVSSSHLDGSLDRLLGSEFLNDELDFLDVELTANDGGSKLENNEQHIYGEEGMNQFSCFSSREGTIF